MRSYPRNSPEAAVRILALVLIADGHVCRSEIDALNQLNASRELALDADGLPRIVQTLCEDLLMGDPGSGSMLSGVDDSALASLMAEVDEPVLQRKVLRLAHGIGHHLGIQVHDGAGRQADPAGTPAPPPREHPYLRNTRTIEPGHVFTIEPGIFFIPMLLRPFREGKDAPAFDWDLVDALLPLGGVRVEDNVLVTPSGPRNLTREVLPD